MGLSALDAKTGKPVWRAEAFQPAQATDIMFDGSAVYAVGFEGKLWAIDAATGTLRWEHVNTPGGKHGGCLSTPIASDGLIIYSVQRRVGLDDRKAARTRVGPRSRDGP